MFHLGSKHWEEQKKFIKEGGISGKDKILTFTKKNTKKGNRAKRSLKILSWGKYLDKGQLEADKKRMNKRIEKENNIIRYSCKRCAGNSDW